MKINFKKHILPYLVISFIFLGIASAYFNLEYKGYTLKQSDVTSWKSASKEISDYQKIFDEQTLWTNSMFGGMPTYQISGSVYTGYSIITNSIIKFFPRSVFYIFFAMLSFFILGKQMRINNWLSTLGGISYGLVSYNIQIIEAGHNTKMLAIAIIPLVIGAFIMIFKNKNYRLYSSLFALFMGFELSANHVQITYYFSILMLFIGFAFFIEYFKNGRMIDFAKRVAFLILASFLALLANFGNYYMTYEYAKDTIRNKSELTINKKGKNRTVTSSGLDRDYIVQWSLGKEESMNLLIPNTKGDAKNLTNAFFEKLSKSNPQAYNYAVKNYQEKSGKIFGGYWGDQPFTSGANYIGAIMIFLALLYLILIKDTLKWAFLVVTILIFFLSWGKNLGGTVETMWFTNFFIDYIPLYNKFRAVSMTIVVINFLVPFMAILFLSKIFEEKQWIKNNIKHLYISIGAILLILASLYVFPNILHFTSDYESIIFEQLNAEYLNNPKSINPLVVIDELIDFRHSIFRKDVLRTIGFILASIFVLFLFVKEKIKYSLAILFLILLSFVDIWNIDKRYLNNDKNPNKRNEYLSWEKKTKFNNIVNVSDADNQIFRIESSLNPQINIDKDRYLEILKENKRPKSKDIENAKFAALGFNSNFRVLNLDNPFSSSKASYFNKSTGGYHAAKLRRYSDIIDFYLNNEISFLSTGNTEKMKILNMMNTKYYQYQGKLLPTNKHAFGNAWFVKNINWTNNPDEEIASLKDIDLHSTVTIDSKDKSEIKNQNFIANDATILFEDYKPNHLKYTSNSNSNNFAVFSEIYYDKGWKAFIDGNEVKIFRANYFLRAINVPSGNHSIEFKFEPNVIKIAKFVNYFSFFLILIFIGFEIFFKYRKSNII